MNLQDVDIARVTVPHDRRQVSKAKVSALASSLLEIGLQHPIGITADFRLIHGRHRLEAYRTLGWARIPAIIHDVDELHAKLAEIDENLHRNPLTKIEEAKAVKRRKELYEAIHPETKQHKAGGHAKHGSASDKMSFADDTAAATGKSRRTVERAAALGDAISDDAAERLAGTKIADNQSELRKFAKLSEEDAAKALAGLVAGAETVQEALTGKKRQKRKPKPRTAAKAKAAELFDGDPTPEQIDAVAEMEEEEESPPVVPKTTTAELREVWMEGAVAAFEADLSPGAIRAAARQFVMDLEDWNP